MRQWFMVLPLLFPASGLAAGRLDIYVWHNTELGEPLKDLVASLKFPPSVTWHFETNFNYAEMLMASQGTLPDVVVGPGDLVSLAERARFSPIPGEGGKIQADALERMRKGGKLYGLPIGFSNFPLLMYNRRMVPVPASTWEDLERQAPKLVRPKGNAVALNYDAPFFFLPFLAAHAPNLNRPSASELAAALKAYKGIAHPPLTALTLRHRDSEEGFFAGDYPYSIGGSWHVAEAQRRLGESFGIAPLPSFGKNRMRSVLIPDAVFFPGDSLTGKKARYLEKLLTAIRSVPVQVSWYDRARSLPANTDALARITARKDETTRVLAGILAESRPLPGYFSIEFWVFLQKTMKAFLAGELTAERAAGNLEQRIHDETTPARP